MDNFDKDYNEVMSLLNTVNGVEEHLNSPEVRLWKQVAKRESELQRQLTKIEVKKIKFGMDTSEELFNIVEQPEEQCPNINYIISELNKAIDAGKPSRFSNDEPEEQIEDMLYYLDGLEDRIEEVRDAVENVRTWGQQWKDFAKTIMEDNDIEIEDYI